MEFCAEKKKKKKKKKTGFIAWGTKTPVTPTSLHSPTSHLRCISCAFHPWHVHIALTILSNVIFKFILQIILFFFFCLSWWGYLSVVISNDLNWFRSYGRWRNLPHQMVFLEYALFISSLQCQNCYICPLGLVPCVVFTLCRLNCLYSFPVWYLGQDVEFDCIRRFPLIGQAALQVPCAFRGKSDLYSFSWGNICAVQEKKMFPICFCRINVIVTSQGNIPFFVI